MLSKYRKIFFAFAISFSFAAPSANATSPNQGKKKVPKHFVKDPGMGPFTALVKTGPVYHSSDRKTYTYKSDGLHVKAHSARLSKIRVKIKNQADTGKKKYNKLFNFGGYFHNSTREFGDVAQEQLKECRDLTMNEMETAGLGVVLSAKDMPKWTLFRKPKKMRYLQRKLNRARYTKYQINEALKYINGAISKTKVVVDMDAVQGVLGNLDDVALEALMAVKNALIAKKQKVNAKIPKLIAKRDKAAKKGYWKVRARPRFPIDKITDFECAEKIKAVQPQPQPVAQVDSSQLF